MTSIQAMGSLQTVPVGQEVLYNVSLDFAGQNVTVEPQEVPLTDDYAMRWTFLGEPEGEGWGAVYVHELVLPQPLANMRRAMAWGLETTSVNVTVEPYVVDGREGWIGTGIELEGGWRCWSVVAPLEYDDENMTSVLSFNAKFENETLNEHLAKTMRIEIAPGNALALLFLASPVMPAVADEVDDLILDLEDEDASVQEEAARALGAIGDPRAVDPLILALNDSDSDVRWWAVDALGKIGDPRAVDPLILALNDSNWEVRYWAAYALGAIGDPRAVDPLILALNDSHSDVRWGAVDALGKIGDPRAVDPLILALNDWDWDVRWGAAWALGAIGDLRAVDPLILALDDSGWRVRENAAEALGKIGDPRAVDPLILALNDSNWHVRGEAAYALGAIGDLRAVDPLIPALNDSNSGVRKGAAKALGEIGDSKAVDPLVDLASKDEDEQVQEVATEALAKLEA